MLHKIVYMEAQYACVCADHRHQLDINSLSQNYISMSCAPSVNKLIPHVFSSPLSLINTDCHGPLQISSSVKKVYSQSIKIKLIYYDPDSAINVLYYQDCTFMHVHSFVISILI